MRLNKRQLEHQLRHQTTMANWYSEQYFKLMNKYYPGPVPAMPSEFYKTGYQPRLSAEVYREAMTEKDLRSR